MSTKSIFDPFCNESWGRDQQWGRAVHLPGCGRTFTRAAGLGAHRRRAHGVAGATTSRTRRRGRARGRGRPTTTVTTRGTGNEAATAVDRDALLAAVFPQGIPPREQVMRAANEWLEEAEQLARIR
jgi:hypothetical protein